MKITCGERFPEFTFDTAYKDGLNSLGVLKGKTVFWVLRYIGCTVCRYDVHKIAERYEEFKAKGAQVFVVMQSDKKHVRDDLSKGDVKLPFEIIIDPKQKIYELLDIKPADTKEEMLGDGLEQLREKGAAARKAGFVHGVFHAAVF